MSVTFVVSHGSYPSCVADWPSDRQLVAPARHNQSCAWAAGNDGADRHQSQTNRLRLLRQGVASSLSDLQRKNLIIEDKKFAPKKLKLFNFNRLPHQVRQAARA
jgi:hypothetical protein